MVGQILFAILALIAILAAIGMLTSKNAVHAALFLVLNFICVALFYLGLNAPFLAMVQVTVYAGAIMVLFLFVIMLLGAEQVPLQSQLRWQMPLAVVLVVALIGSAGFMVFNLDLAGGPLETEVLSESHVEESIAEGITTREEALEASQVFGSPAAVGLVLYRDYAMPLQVVGLLLLVAMIGAVVLTKDEKKPPVAMSDTTEAAAD